MNTPPVIWWGVAYGRNASQGERLDLGPEFVALFVQMVDELLQLVYELVNGDVRGMKAGDCQQQVCHRSDH